MVPELARFFADHAGGECRKYAEELAIFYPDVFLSYGTPRFCTEWWHNYPQDSWSAFMLHAWVLAKDGDWLRAHLDVPWFKVGDLYHVDKLAETAKAYCGVKWEQ